VECVRRAGRGNPLLLSLSGNLDRDQLRSQPSFRAFPFSRLFCVRRTIQFSLFINFLPILGASKRRFVIKFGKPPVGHKSEFNNEKEASWLWLHVNVMMAEWQNGGSWLLAVFLSGWQMSSFNSRVESGKCVVHGAESLSWQLSCCQKCSRSRVKTANYYVCASYFSLRRSRHINLRAKQ